MGLLSDTDLAGLREVAESAMETAATIMVRDTETTEEGKKSVWTAGTTVYGMLYSEPQPVISEVSGVAGVVDVLKFRVPVGTAVTSGDQLVIGGNTFIVEDEDSDSTYRPWVRLTLRRLI